MEKTAMASQRERAAVRQAAVAILLRIFLRCLQNQHYHKTFPFVCFLLLFLLSGFILHSTIPLGLETIFTSLRGTVAHTHEYESLFQI